jgi:hypothetical protein
MLKRIPENQNRSAILLRRCALSGQIEMSLIALAYKKGCVCE